MRTRSSIGRKHSLQTQRWGYGSGPLRATLSGLAREFARGSVWVQLLARCSSSARRCLLSWRRSPGQRCRSIRRSRCIGSRRTHQRCRSSLDNIAMVEQHKIIEYKSTQGINFNLIEKRIESSTKHRSTTQHSTASKTVAAKLLTCTGGVLFVATIDAYVQRVQI